MGGQQSVLKEVELGEALPDDSRLYQTWTDVFPGRFRSQISVTVFIRDFSETDSAETRQFFENGIQVLKQLRHPAILGYCTSTVQPDKALLMTERCRPLDLMLEDLEAVEILDGLSRILHALVFLHDNAEMCHNNVCPSAVFISKDGSWKLGGFECALKRDKSRHWVATDFVKTIKEPVFVPPEDQQLMNKDTPPHSRDSYGFGKLLEYLQPFLESKIHESQMDELSSLIENLTQDTPSARPRLTPFISSPAFTNDLTSISEFLLNIPVKDADSKDSFFRGLIPRLRGLPQSVVARRLAKLLLSRYVLLEPVAVREFLPSFLRTQNDDEEEEEDEEDGVLCPSLFQRYCAPELAKIFLVHESAVRLALLYNFDAFVYSFKTETLESVILPELLLGMKDGDESIVAASMRGLASLVPLLGAEKVTGLQHRKYFAEGRPLALGKLPEPSELVNIKNALEKDPEASRKYDAVEKKRARQERAEERRKEMELRRLEKKKVTPKAFPSPQSDPITSSAESPVSGEKEMEETGGSGEFQGTESGTETEDGSAAPTLTSQEMRDILNEAEDIAPNQNEDEDWRDWDGIEELSGTPHSTPPTLSPEKATTSVISNPPPKQSSPPGSTKSKKLVLTPTAKPAERKKEAPLGSEFDILALDIKGIEEEDSVDFFADMTPNIPKTTAVKSPIKPGNMFQMAMAENISENLWDDSGWGEDD